MDRISIYSNVHILYFYARSCPWSQLSNPMALPLVILGYCHWQAKQATKKAELNYIRKRELPTRQLSLFISVSSFLSVLVAWIRGVSSNHW